MNLGDQISKKLCTGRLYLQLTGDAFWRDLGNVEDFKPAPKVTRKEHMASAGGTKRTDVSLAATISSIYEVTLDEFAPDLIALYQIGTQIADNVQAGGNIVNEQITANSQQGRAYFLANIGASAIVVKVGATTYTQDVDYKLDSPNGISGSGSILIMNGGNIANGSTVVVTYTAAAVTQNQYTGLNNLLVQGSCKLVEFDQFKTVPRQVSTFNGQIYVTNWGDNKEDYTKAVLELLVIGYPTVKVRAD